MLKDNDVFGPIHSCKVSKHDANIIEYMHNNKDYWTLYNMLFKIVVNSKLSCNP